MTDQDKMVASIEAFQEAMDCIMQAQINLRRAHENSTIKPLSTILLLMELKLDGIRSLGVSVAETLIKAADETMKEVRRKPDVPPPSFNPTPQPTDGPGFVDLGWPFPTEPPAPTPSPPPPEEPKAAFSSGSDGDYAGGGAQASWSESSSSGSSVDSSSSSSSTSTSTTSSTD